MPRRSRSPPSSVEIPRSRRPAPASTPCSASRLGVKRWFFRSLFHRMGFGRPCLHNLRKQLSDSVLLLIVALAFIPAPILPWLTLLPTPTLYIQCSPAFLLPSLDSLSGRAAVDNGLDSARFPRSVKGLSSGPMLPKSKVTLAVSSTFSDAFTIRAKQITTTRSASSFSRISYLSPFPISTRFLVNAAIWELF